MNERLFSPADGHGQRTSLLIARLNAAHTCELLGLLRWNSAKMSQIALVTDQHDNDVTVGMVPQLLEPSSDILVRLVLADIVDQQCSNCTAVVGRSNGAIAFLAGGIPDLSLDCLCVNLNAASSEFDADGRL